MQRGKIYFLGFPRLWGFVFNPLSLFYCFDREDTLRAILYQVKNTFGEQHSYLIPVTATDIHISPHSAEKVFHVSPFITLDCTYHFSARIPADDFHVAIHQFVKEGKILTATWDGQYRPLTDRHIWRAILAHPLMTFKVVAAIHWEAWRLWRKGASYIKRPPPPTADIS